jgi:hypothetical protein
MSGSKGVNETMRATVPVASSKHLPRMRMFLCYQNWSGQ